MPVVRRSGRERDCVAVLHSFAPVPIGSPRHASAVRAVRRCWPVAERLGAVPKRRQEVRMLAMVARLWDVRSMGTSVGLADRTTWRSDVERMQRPVDRMRWMDGGMTEPGRCTRAAQGTAAARCT